MDIRGRTLTDATEFLRTLEASHVFTDVVLALKEETKNNVGEVEFTLSSFYNSDENKATEKKPNGTREEQAGRDQGKGGEMIYRRQRKQYIFAGFLAVIAVVNVLFFFILNRPARTEYARLEDSIKQLRFTCRSEQGPFDRA